MKQRARIFNKSVVCSLWSIVLLSTAYAQQPKQSSGQWLRGKELSWPPTAQATNPALNYHALVIGISDYQRMSGGGGWGDLDTAAADARTMAKTLETDYGFKVTSLIDEAATREAVMIALDELTSLDIDDAILVYYAGHGYFDENLGEGFWIPSDARYKDGARLAKEGWVWNSTINTILGGSKARHVLVVADSCYSGSMFRGAAPKPANQDLQWYKRVNAKPSRYLITSGDIEPVMDTGGRHSIFAQHVLDYLANPTTDIFAASDLGIAVRKQVSAQTGQMVRMGPLALPSHAGGEFVFVRKAGEPDD